MNYQEKYLKYKKKYLILKQFGGISEDDKMKEEMKKCNNYETNKKTFISLGWPVSFGKVKNRTSKSPGIKNAVLSNVASGSGRNCIILSDLGSTLHNRECIKNVCHLNFFTKCLSK